MKFLPFYLKALRSSLLIAALAIASIAHGAVDPTLQLKLTKTNDSVVLSWFAQTALSYRVETSTNMLNWTNVGGLINGNNNTVFLTNATPEPVQYYRVNRLFPAPDNSAVFDPATGLLTIIGDDQDNNISVLRNGNDIAVLFSNTVVTITGGTPTVSNTFLMQILGRAGDDLITVANGLPIAHLFGDTGNDTLRGGSANDVLIGGPGNDFVDGNQGADIAYLGDGDDTYQWDPGDQSDIVEGGEGNDILQFYGSNIAENITLTAFGSRLHFTRDIAAITLDVDGVEKVNFLALGGTDNVVVNNLAGTAVTQVNVDLGASIGGGAPDTSADIVTINGTAGPDTFNISTNAGAMEVTGMSAPVRITNAAFTNDTINITGVGGDLVNINGSSGPDTMSVTANGTFARADASGFMCGVNVAGALTLSLNGFDGPDNLAGTGNIAGIGIAVKMDGGEGEDNLLGSNANDLLVGGPGNDFLDGNQGSDTILGGEGNDTIQWDPGDGSDTIEGQGGSDLLAFNGSNISEILSLFPDGSRLHLTRDIGAINLDVEGVERVTLLAIGGTDNITVNNLASTVVTQVNVNLAAFGGGGDSAADTVIIGGSPNTDVFSVSNNAGALEISRAAIQVRVLGGEFINDRVAISCVGNDEVNINGSAGPDSMTFAPSPVPGFIRTSATGYVLPVDVAGSVALTLNGLGDTDIIMGSGEVASFAIPIKLDGGEGGDYIGGSNAGEIILGGPGFDVIDGNQGVDTVFMGADDDLYIWDSGDGNDIVEGQGGNDALLVNSSATNDIVNMSANGARLSIFHSGGGGTLDVDGVERLGWQGFTGADNLSIGNLAGTAVQTLDIDLAATSGGVTGDGAADFITLLGTDAPDAIGVTTTDGAIDVKGLIPALHITHSEVANDGLTIHGLGGTDSFSVGPGVTSLITVITNQ